MPGQSAKCSFPGAPGVAGRERRMRRSKWALVVVSLAVVILILAGGIALRAGAAEGTYR